MGRPGAERRIERALRRLVEATVLLGYDAARLGMPRERLRQRSQAEVGPVLDELLRAIKRELTPR